MFYRSFGLLAYILAQGLGFAAAAAGYHQLVVTADGSSIYFRVNSTPVTESAFVARVGLDGTVAVESVPYPVEDVSGDGSITIGSTAFYRVCYGGMDCLQ